MDISLDTTDKHSIILTPNQQELLSHSWEFFSVLSSDRWSNQRDIPVPFSSSTLIRFFAVISLKLPRYDDDLERVCQYFSPKDDSWLLSVVLPGDTPLEVFRRIGVLECVTKDSSCACTNSDKYNHYCSSAIPRKPVDVHVVVGILTRVGYWGPMSEQLEAKYVTLVRACKELGDEYYEAYFALMAYSAGVKTLVTYERVRTLLQYHHDYVTSNNRGVDALEDTLRGGCLETDLALWTAPVYSMHPTYGVVMCVDRPLYQVGTPLREAIVSSLRDLLKSDAHNMNVSNWLTAYESCEGSSDLLD